MKNEIVEQVKGFIRNPSEFGYPKVLIMMDCQPLCHKCAKDNFKLIVAATKIGDRRDGWCAGTTDVFWEGAAMECSNCYSKIESAYGDPDSEGE